MNQFAIKYSDVHQDVLRLTEYIGMKAGAFDKLRAIEEDKEQLHKWWLDGLVIVGTVLDRIIVRPTLVDAASDSATFELQYKNDNSALLAEAAARVVVLHIVVRWLQLVAPALVEAYTADFAQARDELTRLAYYREMPK